MGKVKTAHSLYQSPASDRKDLTAQAEGERVIEETIRKPMRPVKASLEPETPLPQDHGGDLDAAVLKFGGVLADWIDLSTGINRKPYPMPEISRNAFHNLSTRSDIESLVNTASAAYQTRAAVLPVAGAQAAIQLVPRLMPKGRAAILTPTYNEYKACYEREGWTVREVADLEGLAGGDVAVVVNPNNPDGRIYQPKDLLEIQRRVALLVVDESFTDPTPELSLAPHARMPGVLVLRSFGKFFGLAGLRLGFAVGSDDLITRLQDMAGPWQVSGPAIELGRHALADSGWQRDTIARLKREVTRLDTSAANAGWGLAGGTHLFRLYRAANAVTAQTHLAHHQIWSRIFPWSHEFIRLGLPGSEAEWARLEAALSKQ